MLITNLVDAYHNLVEEAYHKFGGGGCLAHKFGGGCSQFWWRMLITNLDA